jgi:parallel beta-helix repeat protein
MLTNCTFSGNSAGQDGGGMYNYASSNPTLTNCLFIGNAPDQHGGGMANWRNCNPMLTNCTFSGNSAQHGCGMVSWENCSPTLINCIFWGNTPLAGGTSQIHDGFFNGLGCSTTVSYSNVQGGWSGEGNIETDPYFADPNNGDYHLRSEAGRWNPNSQSWVLDDVTSPCIDRGDPNSTVGDELDPNGGIINMGAYGGTAEASMSIGMLPPLPPIAHWALDEVDGAIAYDSAGTYDGTLVGDPVWQPEAGMVGGALEFDGIDDYFNTRKFSAAANRCLSVFAWIKSGMPGQAIISQKGWSDWLLADTTEGSLMTELKFFGKPVVPLYSPVVITDGNWHHVGLVWDGSNRILYVDGVEVVSDIYDKGMLNGELQIGAGKNLDPGTFWSGLIDDVRIYNVALSAEEIESLAQ